MLSLASTETFCPAPPPVAASVWIWATLKHGLLYTGEWQQISRSGGLLEVGAALEMGPARGPRVWGQGAGEAALGTLVGLVITQR